MSAEYLRAFIAVELAPACREALAPLIRQGRQLDAHVSWVSPENMHLTLVFLGEVFPEQAASVGAGLDLAAKQISAFDFQLAGTGHFGSLAAPRVLWVGVQDPAGGLMQLHAAARQAAVAAGITLESRAFTPHLTLGRVRSSRGARALTSFLASAKSTSFGTTRVERILLMRSHLEARGVRYSIVHEAALKGD